MAKLEIQNNKKQKAKKRKHSNSGQEDEVADKSVIVEDTVQSQEEDTSKSNEITDQETPKPSKKRKNKDKSTIREKRSKSQDSNVEYPERVVDSQHLDNDMRPPTLEEIKESEKPENNLAIVTGRQKKKQKRQQILAAQKDQSVEKEKQRNEEYLKKWKNSRDEWKFEKLRQISIQQTMFEANKLNADVWSVALEYLAGSKGTAKDKIVKIANEVIDKIDKNCENMEVEAEKQELLNSVEYQRARDLLQTFD